MNNGKCCYGRGRFLRAACLAEKGGDVLLKLGLTTGCFLFFSFSNIMDHFALVGCCQNSGLNIEGCVTRISYI